MTTGRFFKWNRLWALRVKSFSAFVGFTFTTFTTPSKYTFTGIEFALYILLMIGRKENERKGMKIEKNNGFAKESEKNREEKKRKRYTSFRNMRSNQISDELANLLLLFLIYHSNAIHILFSHY